MSQPRSKLSDYTEFLPQSERRAPLPITNLPTHAISEEMDPTLELRTLIEQLQQNARDARNETRAAEQQKDGLEAQLARAEQQIEALRENERELRSHFVEVTSLIKERDRALEESERRGVAASESGKKLESALRERHEAQRQRDEALRSRDEAARKISSFQQGNDEQARLVGETQKQILTIRQARDAAHAQIIDLTNRLNRSEDRGADLEYQRELAEKATKEATGSTAEYRRQLEVTTFDRDATARQVEQLTAELDTERRRLLALAEQNNAVHQADGEQTAALAEARSQVLNLAQERDAARTRAQEQAREIEELRAEFQKAREDDAQLASQALAEAREKLAGIETQARESRHGARNLRQELDAVHEQLAALRKAGDEALARHHETRQQLETLTGERDAALTAVTAAQDAIAELTVERDRGRAQATENAVTVEAQLLALRDQMAAQEVAATAARAHQSDLQLVQGRFEKQRVETIDLAARLQGAQREIRELSANLAEARLQVKFATATSRAAKIGPQKSDAPDALHSADPGSAAGVPATEDPLTEKEARGALSAMRHCFQSFTKTPGDLSLLNELHCHVHGFSERARTSGYLAVYRLCASFSELTRGLYVIPEQVNQSTLRTVQQTIEFLAALMKDNAFLQARDPAKTLIYAVDDDADNCDAIRMAMETAALRTLCAQQPGDALVELAATHCDLIILDVNLPGMDGFELCKAIREFSHHATTPIVFLTGLATLENRVQSTLSGGNEFIAKPFNLHELSVKVMTLILKEQLRLG